MKGLKTAVHVNGTLNQRDDKDRSWVVEMAIPAAEVPGAKQPLKAGHSWRANLFRFDHPAGQKRQDAASFSPPIVPDFHALDAFGTIRFTGRGQTKSTGKLARNSSELLVKSYPTAPYPLYSAGAPKNTPNRTKKPIIT